MKVIYCLKCVVKMQPSTALAPALACGVPDTCGGDTGQTLVIDGAVTVDCLKCPECGHSVRVVN